jgi:hypothetical protein
MANRLNSDNVDFELIMLHNIYIYYIHKKDMRRILKI